ncbi:S-layer homology domain-containing protein [Aminipila sp.]|uniref:S-layer homology domain-containing protein n=1 Tax=Aminipila sp. TaxID=2060095 RepID=UPI002896F38C|nr:S-layer homology domain-containing protein [Aminipila sp.]
MRKNKFTKILMTCVVCGTVALNFSPVFAANNSWSAQAISDFLSNKIDAPTVLKDEKYLLEITREEFAELIVGIYAKSNNMDKKSIKIKENPFKDTTNIDVQRAYSLGIIQGVGKTTFDPNSNITREQIATMLTRFLNIKKIDTSSTNNLNSFTDKNDISNWSFDSLSYCVDNQIIQGAQNQLQPKESTTVEQAITMLDRIAIKNNWITKSKDIYVFGFLLPNDTQIQYELAGNVAFELRIDWNNVTDPEKTKKDLEYMLNKRFKGFNTQIKQVNDVVIKAKQCKETQGTFDSEKLTVKEYEIWVSGIENKTYIRFEDASRLGDVPPIPSPQNHP